MAWSEYNTTPPPPRRGALSLTGIAIQPTVIAVTSSPRPATELRFLGVIIFDFVARQETVHLQQ